MNLLDLVFPFSIGVLSFFSPCVFPLIPGYIGYLMGGRSEVTPAMSLLYGLACLSGVLASTALLGAAAALLKTLFPGFFLWVRVALALAILLLGLIFLSPLEVFLPLSLPGFKARRGFAGFLLYGVFFGPLVFTCQLPLVASLFLYSLTVFDALESLLTFIVYGLGLGVPLLLLSLATATARQLFVRKAGQYYAWIRRAGGLVLILVALYLLWEALSASSLKLF